MLQQIEMFDIETIYAAAGRPLKNKELYDALVAAGKTTEEHLAEMTVSGESGSRYSVLKRKIRWYQQTLKSNGMLQRTDRDLWELTDKAKDLHMAKPGCIELAYSTDLGIGVFARSQSFFDHGINEPIVLCVTSPPYPGINRKYGKFAESECLDLIYSVMEGVIKNLDDGGSICLNLGHNIFNKGLPSRSLYVPKLLLGLCERFGLHYMDDLIWENTSAAPSPIAWSSKKRIQLKGTYEHVLWLTNNPLKCQSNNQRVLQPHSEQQKRLIARGGESRGEGAVYADGAYRIKPGAFGNNTKGSLPKNIMKFSHNCAGQRSYRDICDRTGLPRNAATFPENWVSFLVEFMTEVGQLVVDPFSGSGTVPAVCEKLKRPYVAIECALEFCAGQVMRLREQGVPGLTPNRDLFDLLIEH